MKKSLWTKTVKLPAFPALEEDVRADVLIIGGGLAGLLCARELGRAGVDYLLIEADRICRGVTAGTTAKITAQHGLIYHKLLQRFGRERARLYWEANRTALERFKALGEQIPCHMEERDNGVYSLDDRSKLEREMEALSDLGIPARLEEHPAIPLPTAGAVCVPGQAQFHPLEFAAGLARGLNIREGTRAESFEGMTVRTNRGVIRAKKIIVATHFPILNKHGSYFLKLYQHRSYVLALEGGPQVDGMYVDESGDGMSFRNFGDTLLLGGGSHRTGKQGGGWRELEDFRALCCPQSRETARWAAQDCMTLDGVPYIGQYSRNMPDLYVATGFNKWGMTSSMAAAILLTDLARGRNNPWAEVFSPSRSMLRTQLLVNGVESTLNLLTPTVPRCPHLGCALKWNKAEHSWDCPCHGSRFGADGRLLDGPATGPLKNR